MDLDAQLLSNKAAGTFTTEKVLAADGLDHIGVDALQLDLDGVGLVQAVVLEANNGPGSIDGGTSLLDLVKEDALDLTLVDEGGERVSGVDEARAAGPASSAVDSLVTGEGIPESDIVDLGGLIGHNLALQAQVAEDLSRAGLDSVGAASGGGYGSVIDVLNLVAPTRHAQRQENANGASAHNDDIILLLRLSHDAVRQGICVW